jgi:hypothetical protein
MLCGGSTRCSRTHSFACRPARVPQPLPITAQPACGPGSDRARPERPAAVSSRRPSRCFPPCPCPLSLLPARPARRRFPSRKNERARPSPFPSPPRNKSFASPPPLCTDRGGHGGGALGAHVVVAGPLPAAQTRPGQPPGPAQVAEVAGPRVRERERVPPGARRLCVCVCVCVCVRARARARVV